ncbi:MAG: hypothetical protein ABI630_05495 [Betaproteobacteria bacterium]
MGSGAKPDDAAAPPGNTRAPLDDTVALLRARDWEAAHEIAQESTDPLAAWAHGIVHLIEGDESNARYWYERAVRTFPGMDAIDAEIGALERELAAR